MDISATIEPKSDQLNAEDLLTGPRTFTIGSVTAGSSEQPVNIELVELPGRAYRPSKTQRRVIVFAWGAETSTYVGRRLTLYRDPDVRFGAEAVGGIKISHLSHIDKPFELSLTHTRGKRAKQKVGVLADGPVGAVVDLGKQLADGFAAIGLAEPADKLKYASDVVGREITSPAELTEDETLRIIQALKDDAQGAAS